MNTRRFRAWQRCLLLGAALLACLLWFSQSALAAQPANCADVKAASPLAPDGEYWITANGKVFQVYCFGMAGTPKEYLTLLSPATNYSVYPVGSWILGTDVKTIYSKIRIDPSTLLVDVSDTTFSSSTGSNHPTNEPNNFTTWVPYATSFQCGQSSSPWGTAEVDLTGLRFKVADTFYVEGSNAHGNSTFSADNKVVTLSIYGYCGTISPTPGYWVAHPSGNEYILNLAYVPMVLPAAIDIQPGDAVGAINVSKKGVIPVAVLTTDTLDATLVDPASAKFGPNKATSLRSSLEDVNGDGRMDMMLFFAAPETGIDCGQPVATMTLTANGLQYEGADSIKVVPCK